MKTSCETANFTLIYKYMSSVTIGEILSRNKSPHKHNLCMDSEQLNFFSVHLSTEKKGKGEGVGNNFISRISGFSMQQCRGILLLQSVPSFSFHGLQRTVANFTLKNLHA